VQTDAEAIETTVRNVVASIEQLPKLQTFELEPDDDQHGPVWRLYLTFEKFPKLKTEKLVELQRKIEAEVLNQHLQFVSVRFPEPA
jgi:hypothetical protein